MPKFDFPEDFIWGTATASFQVEGAAYEDGRGESIWDRFCRMPGKVFAGDNGDVACDQYHRYPEDIKLMKEAGIQAYRFSIAWPRIYPEGTGQVNPKGLAYYRALATALRDAGIEPVATLYHWDLPQALQERGGWESREIAFAFEQYAKTCFAELGDLIHTWITLNEPWCSAYLGYAMGHHAPGLTDINAAVRAVHHLNLAHGLAVRAFRASGKKGRIGITWNIMIPRPATRQEQDVRAAEYCIDRDTRMFTGPVCGHGYPRAFLASMGLSVPEEPGDMEIISQKIDFAGLNYYSESAVAWDVSKEDHVRWVPTWQEKTDMGWPIVPQGFKRYLRWLTAETGGIPIYVTENGCAQKDEVVIDETGLQRVHDTGRIAYLRSHFLAMKEALDEGIPLKGYFLWSLLDNFEWAHGYSKRFGIIYMNYETLQRIPKDSYYYYRDVIAGYGE
ncbi:GH1 family beta-glucosidase [Gracilinema caldarium]|uniref:GH1 family beta-glucosidase n=1 Tax=Gracilinema caldarium TaxID=215591 RepID=UPI0026ECF37C|nr:GH1 family beta-glucosidase [Gracilinema caldarium]